MYPILIGIILTMKLYMYNTNNTLPCYYDQKIRPTHISRTSGKVLHICSTKHKKVNSPPEKLLVVVSAYSGSVDETDSTPNITANNTRPISNKTCAVSRDLKHLIGENIYIDGKGVLEVNDLMNKRYSKRVDIFMGSKREARLYGKQEKIMTTL